MVELPDAGHSPSAQRQAEPRGASAQDGARQAGPSGLYDIDNGRLFQDIAADIRPEDFPIQRWAAALAKQREQDMRKDDPIPIACHRACPGSTQATGRSRSFKLRDS